MCREGRVLCGTHVGAEVGHVHLLGLFAHSLLVSEDGPHDEEVGEDDDDGGEQEVKEEDAHVVGDGL